MIAEILGVPASERARVLGFGAAAAPSLDLGLTWRQFRTVETALAEFDAWLGGHLDALRDNPGDDLLSQLVAARDDGVGLDERELKATAGLVLAAGFETTVNLLGNGVALLDAHRDQLELLRSAARAVAERGRRDPAARPAGAADRAHRAPRHHGRRHAASTRARWSPPCSPRPTATPRCSPTRPGST